MATPKIAIINYGAGNLRSVAKAFERIGYPPVVTTDPKVVAAADAVVLPGVGAALDTMTNLHARGMVEAIHDTVAKDRPFFGVCIGLQVLFEASDEGGAECLGVLPGRVRRLSTGLKVPHMGWNQVEIAREHPLFAGIPNGSNFYFVHSYCAEPADSRVVLGRTEYGEVFCSVVARGNLVGTQFHPEKSGTLGLQVYANFVERVVGARPMSQRVTGAQARRAG
ncbi:MAG: imidazole glycerol phosphate synthase subunit HisH [Chloroflexi bacterium]|nr:imidazole glycerol phosphate synthase subunit HisH [Chloroflexota bacterium]